MSKKGCELCSNPARMFCDSDQASLCWDCDEKVHAANFLVAKHSRTLLCHVCHSPTPWKAAGSKLGPTLSVCNACARRGGPAAHQHSQNTETDRETDSDSSEDDDDDDDDEDEDEDEDVDEDGENQVVPWSASASDSPPAASSSSEEENVSLASSSSSKRIRDDDDDVCCSSEMSNEESDENYCASSLSFLRPLKTRRGTAAIVEKLRRFEQEIATEESGDAAAMIVGLCHLTRD